MMKSRLQFFLLILFLSLSFSACQTKQKSTENTSTLSPADSIDMAFDVKFKYAKGVAVQNFDGYKVLTVYDPDNDQVMEAYTLYNPGIEVPQELQESTKLVQVPAKTLACHSTTHIGALPLLGLNHVLIGATGMENIYNPDIRKMVDEGKIQEIGSGMTKSPEQLLAVHPDILLQDLSIASEKDEDLERSGIRILLYNEWKEHDLLGRAEWMKVIGMLFGRNAVADSVFNTIENNYIDAKNEVHPELQVIPIMYGQDYKGTWYVPGEFSYPASLFRDAKVSYEWAEGRVSSIPKGFETIFSKHRHAKYWIVMDASRIETLDQFLSQNERYKLFDAVKEGHIFINRKRLNEFGGNDFWESAIYRPDLLLKDFIKMTRPHLLEGYEVTYFNELQ